MTDPLKEAAKLFDLDRERRARVGAPGLIHMRRGTDMRTRPVVWEWKNRWVKGELNLLDAHPEMLKTTLALGVGARRSAGLPLFGDPRQRPPATCILFSPEEDAEISGLPKFIAAGGDRARFLEFMRGPHSGHRQMVFPGSEQLLDDTFTSLRAKGEEPGVLIFDGVSVILPDGKSENVNNDVKLSLEALLPVTRKHGVTVIGVRHTGKAAHASVGDWGLGSMAWRGMARSQWVVMRHPDEQDQYVFANAKPSYVAKGQCPSMTFTVKSVDVVLDDGTVGSYGCVEFLSESELSAQEWAERVVRKAKKRATKEELQSADAFLRTFLADGVMRDYKAVVEEAKAKAGIDKGALWAAAQVLRKERIVKFTPDEKWTGDKDKRPWLVSVPVLRLLELNNDDREEAPF